MRMCIGCPFRDRERRMTMIRFIVAAPDECWPCHESAEFDDLTPTDCAGRQVFGRLVQAQIDAET